MAARKKAEERIVIGNETIRLDFDPRTSDTMYNYIWVRRPETNQWERLHNFGVDVAGYDTRNGQEINTIGMNLKTRKGKGSLRVTYPHPLIQYRQFDDKIGSEKIVRQYPDFADKELPKLVHADGSVEFDYQLDPERPSFIVSGRHLEGKIGTIVYILDALWTDNQALPTHEYIESFPEYCINGPEAMYCHRPEIQNVAFVLFYRHDGNGVPFALIPQRPDRAGIGNYFNNWRCDYDFHTCSMNQQYVPHNPAITGCNDIGYITSAQADGSYNALRIAFFPELAYLKGGIGMGLREQLVAAIYKDYSDALKSWDRKGKWLRPTLTTYGTFQPVSEL